MKKHQHLLALVAVLNLESVSANELDYAKQQAHCAGMGFASERFSNSVSNQVGVALARTLTNSAQDDELIKSFNLGYKEAKLIAEQVKLEIAKAPNNIESISKEMSLMNQGTLCRERIKASKSDLEKISKIGQQELIKNSIPRLSDWLR